EQGRIAHRHQLDSRIGNNFFFFKNRFAAGADQKTWTRNAGALTVDRHSQRRRRRGPGLVENEVPLVAIYARRAEVLEKNEIAMEPARGDGVGQNALSLPRIVAP